MSRRSDGFAARKIAVGDNRNFDGRISGNAGDADRCPSRRIRGKEFGPGAIGFLVVRYVLQIELRIDDVPHREAGGFDVDFDISQALFYLLLCGCGKTAVGFRSALARYV